MKPIIISNKELENIANLKLSQKYEEYLLKNDLPDTLENAKDFILSFLTKKS